MIKIWMTKLIKIPIIQVSFMYILKISAIKSIKTSVTTIVKITDRNAGMQNELNCQITRIRKTWVQNYSKLSQIFVKYF